MNVPYQRNPDFTGRDELLASLTGQLAGGGAAAVTQVLQGGGGVGKTTLAVEYAYWQRGQFDTVWWVRAEQPTTLISDLADLAVTLGLAERGEADQQLAVAAVRRWLADHDRWLLILDNAGAPDTSTGLEAPLGRLVDLLPQVVHGQVLVTSRDAHWEHHAILAELEVFTPQEAVAFLLARSGSSDEEAAAEVAQLLGFLPLALEQTGAYVRETQISLGAYQARLERSPVAVLRRGAPRDRDPADTVATTWQLSLEQVSVVPGATALLELCAFLAPDDIPRTLLERLGDLAQLPDELAVLTEDALVLDAAVAGLRRFGLLKASPEVVAVHRLVQQVVRDRLSEQEQRRWAKAAVDLLCASFPNNSWLVRAWTTCQELLRHVLAAVDHAARLDIAGQDAGWLLDQAGRYLRTRGQYREAKQLAEQALDITQAVLGPEKPEVGDRHDGLGRVLYVLGDYQGARQQHERALAVHEAAYGPDNPKMADRHGEVGRVLRKLGDLIGARAKQERALAISEAAVGPDDPELVIRHNDLGRVLHDLGDLARARDEFEKALAICEARLGPDDLDTAWSVSNLADVLRDQGGLDESRDLHERALAIREVRLGADHPTTAQSLSNLANVLRGQGDSAGARQLHERALSIFEARLGADHPRTALSLENLASLLDAQGDLDASRPLFERALEVREARLGPDHPDTVRSREALAAVAAALDKRQSPFMRYSRNVRSRVLRGRSRVKRLPSWS